MKGRGHNEKTEQELYEDQQFLRGYSEIQGLRSDMAGTKGDMNAVYKRLKDLGFTKKDVEFAQSLEDKDVGQVISDFERKIRIARLFGHQLGRQLDLLEKDKTSEQERAFEAGRAAGQLRKQVANPYQPGTREYEKWEDGMKEGTQFINREMGKAMGVDEGRSDDADDGDEDENENDEAGDGDDE